MFQRTTLGKQKIAQVLCRAGLHLTATTVGRLRKQEGKPVPPDKTKPASPDTKPTTPALRSSPWGEGLREKTSRSIIAKGPNHTCNVDLTTVPTNAGFWVSWLPFALPQCWPFCWWIAVVVDRYSRRALGYSVFKKQGE